MPGIEYTTAVVTHGLMGRKSDEVDREELQTLLNQYGAEIALSEEGRLLGHIPLSQRLLDDRSGGMSAEKRLALAHCVLCHHGADMAPGRRFGSPEALALYRLNALDASVKGALEHGLP